MRIAFTCLLLLGCSTVPMPDASQSDSSNQDATAEVSDAITAPDAWPDASGDTPAEVDAVASCADSDRDGHRAAACGGDDCDDANPNVHPGANEICDGVDENCDGHADDPADPALAQLDAYCASTATIPPPGNWNSITPNCAMPGRMTPMGSRRSIPAVRGSVHRSDRCVLQMLDFVVDSRAGLPDP